MDQVIFFFFMPPLQMSQLCRPPLPPSQLTSCVSMTVFLHKKSDVCKIYTKPHCNLQVFTLNGVKCFVLFFSLITKIFLYIVIVAIYTSQ